MDSFEAEITKGRWLYRIVFIEKCEKGIDLQCSYDKYAFTEGGARKKAQRWVYRETVGRQRRNHIVATVTNSHA